MSRFSELVKTHGTDKAINTVLTDPGVSFFTQDIIRRGLDMDPLDAARGAELAAEALRAHLDKILPPGTASRRPVTFDYAIQAWTDDATGTILKCGHTRPAPGCTACEHLGKTAATVRALYERGEHGTPNQD